MITAEEARKISKQSDLLDKTLKSVEKAIQIAAQRGECGVVFDTDTNNHNVIAEVVDILRANSYKVLYVPYITTICIEW